MAEPMSREAHLARGWCCGNGCAKCPWSGDTIETPASPYWVQPCGRTNYPWRPTHISQPDGSEYEFEAHDRERGVFIYRRVTPASRRDP